METKKRLGWTLLLILVALCLFLAWRMQMQNRVIASQERSITELQYRQEIEREILEGDETIMYLREKKRQNCELLGTGMSVGLLSTCGSPK